MKKLMLIFLCFVLAFSFVACDDVDEDETLDNGDEKPDTTPTHVCQDGDNNSICDGCGVFLCKGNHVDQNHDGRCEGSGCTETIEVVHTDENGDNRCDVCQTSMAPSNPDDPVDPSEPEAPSDPEAPEEPSNVVTKPEAEILSYAAELVGSAAGFTKESLDGEYDYLISLYKENGGNGFVAYVVVMSENYEGVVESEALIHIGMDGKIVGIKKLTFKTSDAMFGYVPPTEDVINAFYDRLPGNDGDSIDGVDLVTNATNTATNVVNSIKEAIFAVEPLLVIEVFPTPEAELIELSAELVGGAPSFTILIPSNAQYVKRVLKDENGAGYVAYVVVMSENYEGVVESEALIHIGLDGKIVGIKKLTFKTSDAIYGYVPPTTEAVDEFYTRIPGNGADTIDGVDLVTNATNTSTNVITSIKEALDVVAALIKEDALFDIIDEILPGADLIDLTPPTTQYVKKIYEDQNGNGYIAHVLVMSENYAGVVESEALIHIGADGKIVSIKKLTFKTSDAIYGYVPPTEDSINAFYERLPGNGTDSIDGVDLVTNATNTSTNVINSIKEALAIIDDLIITEEPSEPEEGDEILDFIESLVPGADFTKVSLTGEYDYLVDLYKENSGNTYVAHVLVMSTNYVGVVESEALVHIGEDGKIINIKKLAFKTSDAIYGYVPPTEDAINAFYDRLPGNGTGSIDGVDLVTNATNTSTNVVNSIKEALEAVSAEIEMLRLAKLLVPDSDGFTKQSIDGEYKYLRSLYKENGGNGYVAHVLVISENYGTVESEALIHIGEDGKIISIKKLVFKTSDAIYGYVPPTAELVDAFYASLPGNGSDTIDGVDLVTNATSTSGNVVKSIKEALSAAASVNG